MCTNHEGSMTFVLRRCPFPARIQALRVALRQLQLHQQTRQESMASLSSSHAFS
jgi:hypothetical protein